MTEGKKAEPRRRQLTDAYIRTLEPRAKPFLIWDLAEAGNRRSTGLALRVQPTGTKTFKVQYRHNGRLRWFTIDSYATVGLKEAREIARQIRAKAILGEDPHGDRMKEREEAREGDTLAEIHTRYLKIAKQKNKSWKQPDALMRKHVLCQLGRRKAKHITRQDIYHIFDGLHNRPQLANQVLAAASAVFSWAIERGVVDQNPCARIERHETKSAARFLSNDEIRAVWPLFDDLGEYQATALRLVLLTAQRPGEVCSMRWEHVDLDAGLWSMPGAPTTGWPGTKNGRDHEVPLTKAVLELLQDLDPQPTGHVFPSTKRGKAIQRPRCGPIWEAAGIPPFRGHNLRATAATKMDELGLVRQHISLVLNHTEGGVTAGYVRHDKRQHKRAALETWAEELLAILEGKGKTDRKAEVVELAQKTG